MDESFSGETSELNINEVFRENKIEDLIENLTRDKKKKPSVKESHRKHLIKEAKSLERLRKPENDKLVILNKALTEHLCVQGVDFHPDLSESSTKNYHVALECLFKFDKKRKMLENIMNEEKLEIIAVTKNDAARERSRLKKSLSDKLLASGASIINPSSGQPLSMKMVTKRVNQFIKAHDDFSTVRYDFIITQNQMAELNEKEDQLDDLGDGLRVLGFESLKTEVQTSSLKIDAKHEQLDRLRHRYKHGTVKLEADQEKNSQFLACIEQEKARNEALNEGKEKLRSQLSELKLTKIKLLDETNKITEKAGIVTKTSLMRNYDDVTDEIHRTSAEISDFEAQIVKLNAQSSSLENEVKELKGSKSSVKHQA